MQAQKSDKCSVEYMRMAPLEKKLLYALCLAIWLILAKAIYNTFVSAC